MTTNRKKTPAPASNQPGKDEKGLFLPGNKFWETRSSHGRNPLFSSPDDLWAACCEYFAWVDSNPLYEDKVTSFQGVNTHEPVAKMRAMTLQGLCLFLDIDFTTWQLWKKDRDDLSPAIGRVEAVIYQHKFAGAAADLLNPNIIARDLGLSDKQELAGPNGGAIHQRIDYHVDEAVVNSALEKLRAISG